MDIIELFAEFIGTYIFLLIIIITENAILIGITAFLSIKIFGGISGGNLNPAVTIMLVLAKKQPVSQLVPYLMAQFLAAIAAFQTYKYLKSNRLLPK